MNITKTRSLVCRLARAEVLRNGTSQSEAMRMAWAAARLVSAMETQPTYFRFVKVSTGEVREAVGVLTTPYVIRKGENWITYWDVEKQGLRRFLIATLLDSKGQVDEDVFAPAPGRNNRQGSGPKFIKPV